MAGEQQQRKSGTAAQAPAGAGLGPEAAKVLTLEEAAALYRLSPRVLLELVKDGKIPHRRFGREYRFHLDRLMQHLAEGDDPGPRYSWPRPPRPARQDEELSIGSVELGEVDPEPEPDPEPAPVKPPRARRARRPASG